MSDHSRVNVPNGGMVRVRVAVAVTASGWSATGNCVYDSDEEAIKAAMDNLRMNEPGSHVFFVTADVPAPPNGCNN
jgi:hypothetical protein